MPKNVYSGCRFLQLKPRDREVVSLKALLCEFKAEDNSEEKKMEYLKQIIGDTRLFAIMDVRLFCAWCTKLDQCCVLTESVVISDNTPLGIILANNNRIEKCPERERDGVEKLQLTDWVLRYLKLP